MPMADVSSTLWSQTRERDATRLIGGTVIAAVFCASDTFCLKSHLTTPSCGERPVPDGAADSSTSPHSVEGGAKLRSNFTVQKATSE